MKLWKCYNCPSSSGVPGRDFTAATPVCPACGLDGTDKRLNHLIVPCKIIHFDAPHPIAKDRGVGVLACGTPWKGGLRVSGDPVAVNCPACVASESYRATKAAQEEGEELLLPESINPPIEITPDGAKSDTYQPPVSNKKE